MKRLAPYLAFVVGIIVIALLLRPFNAAQPRGIRLTLRDAAPIADTAARNLGIPIDKAWSARSWQESARLAKQLETNLELRRKAADDPVIAPRLGAYHTMYYRRGLEKFPEYGYAIVDPITGDVLGARLRLRNETVGAKVPWQQLKPRADAFVQSRTFRGAPSPQFESARPTEYLARTDWIFRYRVKSNFPTGKVVPYLYVYFAGDRFAGWELMEEYADGSAFRYENSAVAAILVRYAMNFTLLIALLIVFLRKYHAGEVGVGTGSVLFAVTAVCCLIVNAIIGPAVTEGSSTGGLDAQTTAWTYMAFKFLLYDSVIAVLVFFAWSVGESFARERWGEKLASFDAFLRRDPFNATVGRSVVNGFLFAPAFAAAAFASAGIGLALHLVHVSLGIGTEMYVDMGGPVVAVLFSLLDAIVYPVLVLCFLAGWNRRRALPIGVLIVLIIGMVGAVGDVPTDPFLWRLVFDFGGIAAAIAIFLGYDLLTTAVALFGGTLITLSAPLMSVARGHMLMQTSTTVGAPLVIILGFGVAALLTRREVTYTYEDLAPHVRRIVERERVKAEIDAANRIQAALLPVEAPHLAGASVASHYRAATEIGGDYFDFLPQPNGEIGIAFGDVSGHGLTSGIVMAMAKSALLVQVDVDASPRTVMNVLNDIVIRTAPRRILMTFFFGLLDPRAQSLRFSSAGHLDPYVYRAKQKRLEALSSWGFPLGVRRREPFREHDVEFEPGDRLILYSDGLIEAIDDDGEPFGFDRFERVLLDAGHLPAEEIKKTLLGSIRKFTRNRPPEDDQTLVVVSFDRPAEREQEVAAAYATAT
jgi:hypothetical protein